MLVAKKEVWDNLMKPVKFLNENNQTSINVTDKSG